MEEAALALGIARAARPRRRTSSPAASCSASRSAPRSPAARGSLLLDEPTSQLDPVAGDELLGVLRRLNEEWGTAVVLAEHRLERCLARRRPRVALRDGAIACDADPRGFLDWAGEHAPELQTPGARLFALAGRPPPPVSVKDARRALGGFEALRARGEPSRRAAGAGATRPRARRLSFANVVVRAPGRARRCCAASTSPSRPASASR